MKYVIIGNSAAATACVEGIRSMDGEGEITIISDENRPAYGRPLISYILLGSIKKENADYRPREFYDKNKVKVLLGRKATAIDAAKKEVTLDGGEKIAYDKLLVSTGSRPFVPPMDGLDKVKDKFGFMSFSDMEKLESALSEDKNVLVLGAGLIGLKCVEGILDKVKSVTVVDLAPKILPSVLDDGGSAIVQKFLEDKGVKFILNDSAKEFGENCAHLKSGAEVPFDILVIAVGVRPETSLIAQAGGEVNRGIVIDEGMGTSLPDIYAAGDCAEGYDMSSKANRVLALMPNAVFQGRCAGINMAGGEEKFTQGIPMNSLGFFGLHIMTAGAYEGECIQSEENGTYKKLFVKGGRLAGFIIIGDIRNTGIYTTLIRSGEELENVDWEAMKKSPALKAFPADERAAKLARKV